MEGKNKEIDLIEALLFVKNRIVIVIIIMMLVFVVGGLFIFKASNSAKKIEHEYLYSFDNKGDFNKYSISLMVLLDDVLENNEEFKEIDLNAAIESNDIELVVKKNDDGSSEIERASTDINISYVIKYYNLGISPELAAKLAESLNEAHLDKLKEAYSLDYKFYFNNYNETIFSSSYEESKYTYYDMILAMRKSTSSMNLYIDSNKQAGILNYAEILNEIKKVELDLELIEQELIANRYSKSESVYRDKEYFELLNFKKEAAIKELSYYEDNLENNDVNLNAVVDNIKRLNDEIDEYNMLLDMYYDEQSGVVKNPILAPIEFQNKIKDIFENSQLVSEKIVKSRKEIVFETLFNQSVVAKKEVGLGNREALIYIFGVGVLSVAFVGVYVYIAYNLEKFKGKKTKKEAIVK